MATISITTIDAVTIDIEEADGYGVDESGNVSVYRYESIDNRALITQRSIQLAWVPYRQIMMVRRTKE